MDVKTKLVATLGPSSDSYETIKALLATLKCTLLLNGIMHK